MVAFSRQRVVRLTSQGGSRLIVPLTKISEEQVGYFLQTLNKLRLGAFRSLLPDNIYDQGTP